MRVEFSEFPWGGVSTVKVFDKCDHPFETAVSHEKYANNFIIVVEGYDTLEEAKAGHDKWVQIMSAPYEQLPAQLRDCNNSEIQQMMTNLRGSDVVVNKS